MAISIIYVILIDTYGLLSPPSLRTSALIRRAISLTLFSV